MIGETGVLNQPTPVQPLQLHFGAEEEEFPELGNMVKIFPYQDHDLQEVV